MQYSKNLNFLRSYIFFKWEKTIHFFIDMSTNYTPYRNNKHNNKIYVGNIPSSVDENEIKEIFGNPKYGKIDEIFVKELGRKENRRHFAFITYHNHKSAEKAISQLNLKLVNGVPIRVSFAENNYKRNRSPNCGNIVVRNINPIVKPRPLSRYFSKFGEVIKFILTDQKTAAFIQYRQKESANQAIKETNGKILKGQKLTVRKSNKPNLIINSGIPNDVKNKESLQTWIENLLEEDDEDVDDYLSDLRKLVLLYFPGKKNTKLGILMFYDDKTTKKIMKKLQSLGIDCNCINEDQKHDNLKYFDKEWKREADNCLFIKNLPNEMSNQDVYNLFKKFEGFCNCIVKEDDNRNKHAFVYFASKNDQINAMNKTMLISFTDENSKYPKQLFASFFTDNKEKDSETKEKENILYGKVEEKLRKKIISKFGEDSLQYQLALQFSYDQMNQIIHDKGLYDKWVQNCSKMTEENENDDEEVKNNEEEEQNDSEDNDDDEEKDDDDYDDNNAIDIDYDDNDEL